MSYIESFIKNFIVATPDLAIPLWQVLLFVLTISLAALYERYRFILIVSYVFMCYWVFIENGKLLAFDYIWMVTAFIFLGIGLVAMVLTLYHMLNRKN